MKKDELEKEVYDLVKLLMQKINFEIEPNPEQVRQDSIDLAIEELSEFRNALNKLHNDSKDLVLYKPLFGKMIHQLYAALDNYEIFIAQDEALDEPGLTIEKRQVIEKQQLVRNDFLKRIQNHYRKGEN